MMDWGSLRVLCLGGAGQVGKEICKQLDSKGASTIIVHDLELRRAEQAIAEVRAASGGWTRADFIASAGDLFHPEGMGSWHFIPAEGRAPRLCRETPASERRNPAQETDLLTTLLEDRVGALTPDVIRRSLIWKLVDAYRPDVVVDTINTATVLGYDGDVIRSGRDLAALGRRVLDRLGGGSAPPKVHELGRRIAELGAEDARETANDLAQMLGTSLRMTAFLDSASMIRFVQCLHALFQGEGGLAVPEFRRYVKVHTTGLGGMGFNVRYTHGDTGEPGLSTPLLGKVCATGLLTQLLLTLSHTPACDVRMVVPATLVGWVEPEDAVIRGELQSWNDGGAPQHGPLPLVDSRNLVPCDGSVSLLEALRDTERVAQTGEPLEVPYLSSGENNPYAAEDIAAVTALGQMGSITKEEVSRAVLECIGGDSRYDVLAAMDAAALLPTQTASIVRDRELQACRDRRDTGRKFRLPSVSLGNLGPSTAKQLYELEILRATFETVERVVQQGTEMEMTLRACSYILEDEEGALLRRQILSLGIPIFLRKGPDEAGVLLGNRLLLPDPHDRAALMHKLNAGDETLQKWLDKGWIDLTGPRMKWWRERFREVLASLDEGSAVSRNWIDPRKPFSAGQFLAYLNSISGGQRKQYM